MKHLSELGFDFSIYRFCLGSYSHDPGPQTEDGEDAQSHTAGGSAERLVLSFLLRSTTSASDPAGMQARHADGTRQQRGHRRERKERRDGEQLLIYQDYCLTLFFHYKEAFPCPNILVLIR